MRLDRRLPLFATLLVLGADCSRQTPIATPAVPPAASAPMNDLPEGLQLDLADADAGDAGVDRPPVAQAAPLSDAATDRLLARLPALERAPRADFALRPASKPPPAPGTVVDLPFPPDDDSAPPDVPPGDLTVLRVQPDGDVPLAPNVTVVFDRPMVALTTQDQAAANVPVTLDPATPGQWRWAGTRVLLFEPDVRLPMATDYTLTVREGTRSTDGSTLPATSTHTFRTPPPTLRATSPAGVVGLSPVIVLTFDQAVDPKAAAPFVTVSANRQQVPTRAATSAEIQADETAQALVRDARDGRWLALVPKEPLPGDAKVEVRVEAGFPSAEGPRTTAKAQSFGFSTYGPLKVVEVTCARPGRPCRPGEPFQIHLSNPFDPDQDLEQVVTVTPDPGGTTVDGWGDRVMAVARTAPNTTYTVRVDAGLRDAFGQTLGKTVEQTFQVGEAEMPWPSVYAPGGAYQVADPFLPPATAFFVQGMAKVRVRISKVRPEDWPVWLDRQGRSDLPLPGEPLVDELRDVPGGGFTMERMDIDLSPWLDQGLGHLLVDVRQPAKGKRGEALGTTWVDATRIGLSVFTDASRSVFVATDLRTGKALPGVEVTQGATRLGVTDAEGLLDVGPLPSPDHLVARLGADSALLVRGPYRWGTWNEGQIGTSGALLVFDDRGMYKPGEIVHLKGWYRRIDWTPTGDLVRPEGLAGAEVHWTARDSNWVPLGEGDVALDALGGFSLDLQLPDTPNLGYASVELHVEDAQASHGFQIQEFRRPEFEVTAQVQTAGPHVLGAAVVASVDAHYYAGDPLPGADTRWDVTASATTWRPPGWDRFQFGESWPWWAFWRDAFGPQEPEQRWEHTGTTDATGVHRLRLSPVAMQPARPMTVTAQAVVEDVNRQAWSASTSFLLHPADRYVGVRTTRGFFTPETGVDVELVVVDLDGNAVPGVAIATELVLTRSKRVGRTWREEVVERLPCAATSGDEPVRCHYAPGQGGAWQLNATLVDEQGRANRTEMAVWVSGAAPPKGVEGVAQERVLLIPDAATYAGGDVAEIALSAPFSPADGVVTWRRGGLLRTAPLHLDGPSATLTVPIEDGHVPDLTVTVELFGQAPRLDEDGEPQAGAPPRPAYASGSVTLEVPPRSRTLDVTLAPSAREASPGETVDLAVTVRDATGRAVPGADVVLMAVDEAVLALSGHELPDPMSVFYPPRGGRVSSYQSHAWVRLVDTAPPEAEAVPGGAAMEERSFEAGGVRMAKMAMPSAMAMDAAAPPPPPDAPIALRTDFRADALWAPALRTDAKGRVTVALKLPDNLTRYRLAAVVADTARSFGTTETDLTARLTLMVRPSAPRFLNFGDAAELPFVVQNQTDRPLEVSLAARVDNLLLAGKDRAGRVTTVPAHDRVEVRLPATTVSAGRARLQVAVAAGNATDAAFVDFPVWTPATTEAFAVYGSLDGPRGTVALSQSVDVPGDVVPAFGGLQISTSSTALQALTDAVIHLQTYPYDCAEQIASRTLSIVALRDVLTAFEAPGLPDPEALRARVTSDLEELAKRQRGDGAWGWWTRTGEASPWVTLHVTHALVRARGQGWTVPDGTYDQALRRVRNIEGMLTQPWSKEARWVASAYATLVLREAGLDGEARARAAKVHREAGDALPLEALGWILPSLPEGDRATSLVLLDNRVSETAATAAWTTSYSETDNALILGSSRRTDAALLDALLQVDAGSDVLPKVAAGLLAARRKGHWESTQEDVWVLLALKRYFEVIEAVTPDLVARAWLGGQSAGEAAFKGRTVQTTRIDVPMPVLTELGAADLVLAREGAGRLYYRLGLSYAPASLNLEPAERGMSVTRLYEAIDDSSDVTRDADGTWHIRAGARVRVTLEMVAPSRRYHVALVDPLPAGLEALNPFLAVTEDVPPAEGDAVPMGRWWWGPWYEHENFRDERVEAFTQQLWPGVHTYRYVARATTPGRFVVPPAKAEEMYHPETFGRTGTDRVVVE